MFIAQIVPNGSWLCESRQQYCLDRQNINILHMISLYIGKKDDLIALVMVYSLKGMYRLFT